jgi:hypothetical protein
MASSPIALKDVLDGRNLIQSESRLWDAENEEHRHNRQYDLGHGDVILGVC